MDKGFWHKKWQSNDIAFHLEAENPLLVDQIEALQLSRGDRVFLPLCGKTADIDWLLGQGYRVAGAELSELAVQQVFARLRLTPKISEHRWGKHYSYEGFSDKSGSGEITGKAQEIDIYVADIFDLSAAVVGPVSGVYDRAALVALPPEMRRRYAEHLPKITGNAAQLLVTYDYDQEQMAGPPFCVTRTELEALYGSKSKLSLLLEQNVAGGLKGKAEALEQVWLLQQLL